MKELTKVFFAIDEAKDALECLALLPTNQDTLAEEVERAELLTQIESYRLRLGKRPWVVTTLQKQAAK